MITPLTLLLIIPVFHVFLLHRWVYILSNPLHPLMDHIINISLKIAKIVDFTRMFYLGYPSEKAYSCVFKKEYAIFGLIISR